MESPEVPAEQHDAAPETELDLRVHCLISSREKMPHDPRWLAARKQTLWRYLARQQAERTPKNEETDASEPHA